MNVDMFHKILHFETVALLSRQKVSETINVKIDVEALSMKLSDANATYREIQEYVLEKFRLKVSTLNIAQVKTKCGIIECENYNKGKDGNRVPKCPKDKENAILDAFKHFEMI